MNTEDKAKLDMALDRVKQQLLIEGEARECIVLPLKLDEGDADFAYYVVSQNRETGKYEMIAMDVLQAAD